MLAVERILGIIFVDKKIEGLDSGHLTPGPVALFCKCFKMVKN